MITEKDSLKEVKWKELKIFQFEKHYSEKMILLGKKRLQNYPYANKELQSQKKKIKILPFISTFNPNKPKTLSIFN